ncbi:hypothetical protein BpHYR1_000360 [Brachionus plicatilis]|uniref:Uncharacterized protein n=1 Tax=Brachionus plicatilis TaxID=10195 RepID=A0A3M7QBN7_BRAPC|nr:hypothetical protein BpHYR1_000360 [Brachionus plicatilis]
MFDEAQNSRAMSASNQNEENKQVLEQHFSLFENLIILVSYVLFVFTFPLSIFCSLKVVQEYERALRVGVYILSLDCVSTWPNFERQKPRTRPHFCILNSWVLFKN